MISEEPIPTMGTHKTCAIFRFKLDQGALAGITFHATVSACGNPCCPCSHLTISCTRDDAPGEPLNFNIDVCTRQLKPSDHSTPEEEALGQAFIAEAQSAEWKWLWERFLAFKREQMETMNLDTLEVRFPDDAMDGGMIGYAELFPWARQLNFTIDGEEWSADDQYCIRLGCKCKQSGLSFVRVPPSESPVKELKPDVFLRFDYSSDKIVGVEETQPGTPSPKALMQALRSAQPDLVKTLSHRHWQMTQLAKRLLSPPAPQVASPRPGRNDPCPCGSGKKFKKCCGAHQLPAVPD